MNMTHQPTPVGLKGFVSMMAKNPYYITPQTMDTLTRLHGQQRHSTPTTQAEQSRWTSQTSTSGHLIRKRVIYYTTRITFFSQQTGYQYTDHSAREDTTTFPPHQKQNLSQKFSTHHILYSRHLTRGVSSRKANTASKLTTTTITTFIFINNGHTRTQSTRTSNTQVVAWPSQQTPPHL